MSDEDITTEDVSNYLRLEKRISELEKRVTRHNGMVSDNKVEIAELRERVEGIYKSVHGIAPNKPDIIIEVLRDVISLTVPNHLKKQLLEKLDVGSARQTEGKDILNRLYDFHFEDLKASGGEKDCWTEEELHPREDLYFCRLCGNEITDVEHEVSKLTKEVKGEDLQWMYYELPEHAESCNTTDLEKFWNTKKRIKEEYGIK